MTLPVGSTLIPVLLTSDQTFLRNFSVDKKSWPLLMSIGNIHSRIRNKPMAQAWILIGLLPVGPKRSKVIKGFTVQQQEYDALTVQHTILERILNPPGQVYEVWEQCRPGDALYHLLTASDLERRISSKLW